MPRICASRETRSVVIGELTQSANGEKWRASETVSDGFQCKLAYRLINAVSPKNALMPLIVGMNKNLPIHLFDVSH